MAQRKIQIPRQSLQTIFLRKIVIKKLQKNKQKKYAATVSALDLGTFKRGRNEQICTVIT